MSSISPFVAEEHSPVIFDDENYQLIDGKWHPRPPKEGPFMPMRLLINGLCPEVSIGLDRDAYNVAFFKGLTSDETYAELREGFFNDIVSNPCYNGNFFKYFKTVLGILQETVNGLAHGSTFIKRPLNVPQMNMIHEILYYYTDEVPEHNVRICKYPAEACKLTHDHDHNSQFYHMDETIMRLIVSIFNGIMIAFGPR
jgi:hypothetical protein